LSEFKLRGDRALPSSGSLRCNAPHNELNPPDTMSDTLQLVVTSNSGSSN
jgi:hypothetical protein